MDDPGDCFCPGAVGEYAFSALIRHDGHFVDRHAGITHWDAGGALLLGFFHQCFDVARAGAGDRLSGGRRHRGDGERLSTAGIGRDSHAGGAARVERGWICRHCHDDLPGRRVYSAFTADREHGKLFREFSLAMAGSILISMFVALSLIPMLCSQFLNVSRMHGRLYLAIERFFVALNHGYERVLTWAVRHRLAVFLFLVVNVILTIGLFRLIPSTLAPIEDRGQFLTVIRAPQGSTLAYTFSTLDRVEKRVQQIPEVEGFFAAVGLGIGGPPNASDGSSSRVSVRGMNER